MRVNAIQGTDASGAQVNTQAVGAGEDFSSYLPATASLDQIFEEASRTYNVPKELIKAIAKAESDFNPNAKVVLVQNVGNHGGYVLRRMGNAGEILRNLWISFHHLGQIC